VSVGILNKIKSHDQQRKRRRNEHINQQEYQNCGCAKAKSVALFDHAKLVHKAINIAAGGNEL